MLSVLKAIKVQYASSILSQININELTSFLQAGIERIFLPSVGPLVPLFSISDYVSSGFCLIYITETSVV